MIKDFQDKVAVITGGASGIGLAAAQRFLDKGAKVVIADMDQDSIDAAIEELDAGDRVHAVCVDISTPEANEALAKETIDTFGKVNIAYFNACTMGDAGGWRASDITVEAWRQTMAASLDGPFYGARAFLPHLQKEEEAQIVFTASSFSFISGLSDPAPYFVSKAGLLSYAECLLHDLADRGSHIGVTTVLPGNTHTGPYHFIKGLLAESEDDHSKWDSSTWGDRDYAVDLIKVITDEGTSPEVIMDALIPAIQENTFYVTANIGERIWKYINTRWETFKAGKNPYLPDHDLTIYRPLQEGEK